MLGKLTLLLLMFLSKFFLDFLLHKSVTEYPDTSLQVLVNKGSTEKQKILSKINLREGGQLVWAQNLPFVDPYQQDLVDFRHKLSFIVL